MTNETTPTPAGPEVGTAAWHLREAGICLAAARGIFDASPTGTENGDAVVTLSAIAQAHAAISAAISAHPTVRSVWTAAE